MKYLVEHHAFTQLHLTRNVATPSMEISATEAQVPVVDHLAVADDDNFCFTTVDELLEFVTKRWQECWVTVDIWDEGTLECLSRRPFFLMVSIDAPVSLRWTRFKKRYSTHDARHPFLFYY